VGQGSSTEGGAGGTPQVKRRRGGARGAFFCFLWRAVKRWFSRGRVVARLRFFYSGKGDTILIEDPLSQPSKWGLIDCCLTERSGANKRIRDFIDQRGITKLEFVCLTHPDKDHYTGMRDLLAERFRDDPSGRPGFGQFWDSGVDFELLAAVAKRVGPKKRSRAIDELYRQLEPLLLRKAVRHYALQPDSRPPVDFGGFVFRGLSPQRNWVDCFQARHARQILQASGDDIRQIREESNNLSAVLVMTHKEHPVSIVLGGDASKQLWEEALQTWNRVLGDMIIKDPRFGAVKVSHHGSTNGLHHGLYRKYCKGPRTKTILTVGPNDPKHPDPIVLSFLNGLGMRVYATCWPTDPHEEAVASTQSLFPFVGEELAPPATGRWPQIPGHDWADIELEVWSDGRITVTPERSLLRPV